MTEKDDDSNGHSNRGRCQGFRIDIGIRTIADVLANLVDGHAGNAPPAERPIEWTDGADVSTHEEVEPGRERTAYLWTSTAERCLVDARFDDGAFVVTVDVPGAGADDVSVGIDPGTDQFVVAENDTVVARVDLPWSSAEATSVWFNNGVLEAHLHPAAE